MAQLVEQDQDLRLDADVERRHRLVGEDEVRAERERAGDADALALAARELVRIAARRDGGRPTSSSRRSTAVVTSLPRAMPCTLIDSPSASAMRWRGSSARSGSWKTICSRRRSARSAPALRAPTSTPSKRDAAGSRRDQAQAARARRSTCRSPIRRRCRAPRRARRRTRRRRARAPRPSSGSASRAAP